MELLAPAGNLEKLKTVYQYGADAAYIGINNFSLRHKADNFSDKDFESIKTFKKDKKLYGAFNIYFHNKDLENLKAQKELIQQYPLDAFIISDIGVAPFLKKEFPNIELHLSTQANCINKEAAKIYQDLGFSRVILGREASLNEIKEIKNYLPDLELETFIHGAMCIAYSGRCFLSRYMADRSANKGNCAHTCRWQYNLKSNNSLENINDKAQLKEMAESGELYIEEQQRPGEKFPIYEGDNFTTILSSRDLCLIDHLKELKDAGIDSFKIEGRMKSLYYAAIITRAYKKGIDNLININNNFDQYRSEIFKVSHREFTTGFLFDDQIVQSPTSKTYLREHMFVGSIIELHSKEDDNYFVYKIDLKNQIREEQEIEYIGPDILFISDKEFQILNKELKIIEKSDHGKETYIKTKHKLLPGYLIRRPISKAETKYKGLS